MRRADPDPNTAPYDQAARYLVRLDPYGYLCWLLAALALSWRFSRWHDTRSVPSPGEPNRVCDTVAELTHAKRAARRAFFVVEFQARAHPQMLFRLLEYFARLLQALHLARGRRPTHEIYAGVVNLTGAAQGQLLRFQLDQGSQIGLHFGGVERTLARESAADLLQDIAAGKTTRNLLGFVPLMQDGKDGAIIEQWKAVAAGEPSAMRRSDYRDLALVFAELARNKTAWNAGLEGWNEMRSALVDGWKEEGRVEGRVEKARELLVALGGRRYGEPDAEAARLIKALTDEDTLERLALRVYEVESWGELLAL